MTRLQENLIVFTLRVAYPTCRKTRRFDKRSMLIVRQFPEPQQAAASTPTQICSYLCQPHRIKSHALCIYDQPHCMQTNASISREARVTVRRLRQRQNSVVTLLPSRHKPQGRIYGGRFSLFSVAQDLPTCHVIWATGRSDTGMHCAHKWTYVQARNDQHCSISVPLDETTRLYSP